MSDKEEKFGGEFVAVAELLGHDVDRLRAGEMLQTYLTLPTLEESAILSRADNHARRLRGQTFFDAIQSRQRLGQGRHDRGEAIIFAGREPTAEDMYSLAKHLPAHVMAISVWNRIIHRNEVLDVSVRGDVWGLDPWEELYVFLNVGTLTLEPGASLVVRGNVFTFLCQHLQRAAPFVGEQQNASGATFDFGILPTPFSVDFKRGPLNGVVGADGADGKDGADGPDVKCHGSVFGPVVADDEPQIPRDGAGGEAGSPGVAGSPGRNGGMCKLAEMTIRHAEAQGQPFVVLVQPGRGGNGGPGGAGGDGGRGGNGGRGGRSFRGLFLDGVGGNGGDGGDGGNGGRGGNGGIGSNIYVSLPPEQEDQIKCISLHSEPGDGGVGGAKGLGGASGLDAQPGCDPEQSGSNAQAGRDGLDGESGRPGRGRPGPPIFLNERLVAHGALPTDPSRE